MLLEKKGKSTERLNNLRPITLTDSNLKIIYSFVGEGSERLHVSCSLRKYGPYDATNL